MSHRKIGNGILSAAPKAIAGIPHPIPYQGSKRQLARLIVSRLPTNTARLVEPFAGSAAISLAAAHLRATRAFFLNDVHGPLIELWKAIVDHPAQIAAGYRRHWNAQLDDERRYYDLVRAKFNRDHRPEDFLYLLARCVKAAIRYNSRGEFNNSPDNRRQGANPDTMEHHMCGASRLLAGRTTFSASDYRAVLESVSSEDVVYMDPPYQGVCKTHNHRYASGIDRQEFVAALEKLNSRGVPYIISYDGRTGDKCYGEPLPKGLGLRHSEIRVGRSTQATLLGRDDHTSESLYLSPVLLDRLDCGAAVPEAPLLFSDAG